jgi:hypothetical protein
MTGGDMKNYFLAVFTAFLFLQTAINAQEIDISTLIQETKNIASRIESPADVLNIGEQVMREVPNTMLAYIPSTVSTGKAPADIKDMAKKRFSIELTSTEINDIQRGVIPTRVRVAIQTRIPDVIRSIQGVELHLKNIGTALYLLNNIVVPTAQPYLSKDLQTAVIGAVTFASANEAAIQAISSKLLDYTGMLKNALNSLQNLSDAQFKNKLVEVVTNVQNQAIPLFNNTIKPFIMQNQGQVFNKLMLFKGVRFSEADAQKVMSALRSLAQGI